MEPIGCLLLLLFLPMFSTISLYQKLRANLCWRFSKDLWIRNCQNKVVTRWTFFRVKLVFECEFEIFGPWDPWTLGLLDLYPPLTPPNTSPYILLPPPISSSYSPSLVWFGYGRGGELWQWRVRLEIDLWPLYWVEGWNLLIPPSYSTLLLNFFLTHPTSSWRVSDD